MNGEESASRAAGDGVIWHPTPEQARATNLYQFMTRHGIRDYDELLRRSTTAIEWFWDAVVRDLGIAWFKPYDRVLDLSRGPAWARWFVGGQLNVARDALDKWMLTPQREEPALIWEGEEGSVRQLSYGELYEEANRLAHGLRQLGIGPGDRVGIFLPMIPETAIALLAVAKVGAIFTPIFSGFAAPAVASRLQDSEARLLITADGFYRRGRVVAMKEVADEAVIAAPSVEHVLVVSRLGRGTEMPWLPGRDLHWEEWLSEQPREFCTRAMESEEPMMLIYTSGTTGRPKGIVHVHGGFPIKAAQDMAHLFDLKPRDTLFWFTDIGWMMGPWLILGTLMLGGTMLLYDGAPDYPGPDRIWALAARHGVTHLGLSPTVIRGLMPHGAAAVEQHDLSRLRVLGSTGEPWNPEPYLWYFKHVGGGRCPIINYSGGTEISGGILSTTPLHPLRATAFSGPIPGMAADVVDDAGRPVRGQVGELVIRLPWPGMTRGFWRGPERYLEAYWSRWSGVWCHGDWASVDAEGYWHIHGRSDDTIKVAGKRIGPAEIESVLAGHPMVQEAAAIGAAHAVKGEAVVAFVVLRPGSAPSSALANELRQRVAQHLGKALQPEAVEFVSQLPRTRSSKIMRRVIRAAYLGQHPGDLSSLENPDAIVEIQRCHRQSPERQD